MWASKDQRGHAFNCTYQLLSLVLVPSHNYVVIPPISLHTCSMHQKCEVIKCHTFSHVSWIEVIGRINEIMLGLYKKDIMAFQLIFSTHT